MNKNKQCLLSSIFQYGLSQLDASALKTRIKPWVDTFLSTSHNISEEDFSIYEANDPFIQGFIMNLEQLLNEFKVNLLQKFCIESWDLINSPLF